MSSFKQRIVIGTAGHIDHGKSTLVTALTGTDPDRLPEEKSRGMTIDIGFAFWENGIAFIDVPGHEKFIKNMVAGVTGIDAALLVIAADDGVMPQTREHYAILSLLNVTRGIVALTKCGLADDEWKMLVEDDVRKLLLTGTMFDAPIIQVDSISGDGIPQLKNALFEMCDSIPERRVKRAFSLPIDRVFTRTGFGTVVTGTVVSGSVGVGNSLLLLPNRKSVRVRGIHSRNEQRTEVGTGERAAINIAGIEKDQVYRGNRLVESGAFIESNEIDLSVNAIDGEKIKHRSRVRLHAGTAELIGRIDLLDRVELHFGESVFARFISEQPLVVSFHERVIIRSYSPMNTIGGGIVLNPCPTGRLRSSGNEERLMALLRGTLTEQVFAIANEMSSIPLTKETVARKMSLQLSEAGELLERMRSSGELFGEPSAYLPKAAFEAEVKRLVRTITDYHQSNPERMAFPDALLNDQFREMLGEELCNAVIAAAVRDAGIEKIRTGLRVRTHVATLSPKDESLAAALLRELQQTPLTPPAPSTIAATLNTTDKELSRIADLLREQERIVILEMKLWFPADEFAAAQQRFISHVTEAGMTIGDASTLLGMTRKFVIAFLEELDRRGVTVREGDVRKLRS